MFCIQHGYYLVTGENHEVGLGVEARRPLGFPDRVYANIPFNRCSFRSVYPTRFLSEEPRKERLEETIHVEQEPRQSQGSVRSPREIPKPSKSNPIRFREGS